MVHSLYNVGSDSSPLVLFGSVCTDPGSLAVYLTATGTTVTCNTVTPTALSSILCPIAKTAIPAGQVTLGFSYLPPPGQTPGDFYNSYFFDVESTTTTTSTTCTPAPTKCNADNCYRAIIATPKAGSSFCSNYLTTAVASTATNVVKGCSASAGRISSACYCLNHPTCNADNCYRAFLASSTAAADFCSSFSAGPVASTPAFASQSCSGSSSRISSACSCLATPPPIPARKRDSLLGRVAEPFNHDLDSVTEVEVLIKRDPGYSGPDSTITDSMAVVTVTTTTTVLGSPSCRMVR